MSERTQNHVEHAMNGALSALSLAGLAIHEGLDIADDESGMVTRGDGTSAVDYLRELVIETKMPEAAGYTDFMLTIGGPTIWVRSYIYPERASIIGHTAGLSDPIEWSLCDGEHTSALYAVAVLLDYDVMDEGKAWPSWANDPSPF